MTMEELLESLRATFSGEEWKPALLSKKRNSGEFKVGDLVLARITRTSLHRVLIVKDEKNDFYRERVTALSADKENRRPEDLYTAFCYYVESISDKTCFWIHEKCLTLVSRPRPYYGPLVKETPVRSTVVRKRKVHQDHILPVAIVNKLDLSKLDLNTTYERHHAPKTHGEASNHYQQFVRRGKERVFDQMHRGNGMKHRELQDKEVENYVVQCWRFLTISRDDAGGSAVTASAASQNNPESLNVTVHMGWCVVCGLRTSDLSICERCPASFHQACRSGWANTIAHRQKIMPDVKDSGSRSRPRAVLTPRGKSHSRQCPACEWGPPVGYGDIVWHKLSNCPWWPARVLRPGELPSCLLTRKHSAMQWPLQYYGDKKYAWADPGRMCLFITTHTAFLQENKQEELKAAIMDAFDDYILVYLT